MSLVSLAVGFSIHGFPYRKDGRDSFVWLDRGNSAGPGGYQPGGFHSGNLMVKGWVVF
jgi:hypothetical protein